MSRKIQHPVYFDQEMLDDLRKLSANSRYSISAIIRLALEKVMYVKGKKTLKIEIVEVEEKEETK